MNVFIAHQLMEMNSELDLNCISIEEGYDQVV